MHADAKLFMVTQKDCTNKIKIKFDEMGVNATDENGGQKLVELLQRTDIVPRNKKITVVFFAMLGENKKICMKMQESMIQERLEKVNEMYDSDHDRKRARVETSDDEENQDE
jgi:hypothetical protein